MTRKYLMTVAFDGAAYQGWQSQRSGRGVADVVGAAWEEIFGSPPELVSSSRTDAGVHARGLCVHATAAEPGMEPRRLVVALNAGLPADVRVMAARRVSMGFDARKDAKWKEYRYHIWNAPVMDPLRRGQAWHVPRQLDAMAMREAAHALAGRCDFRAFTTRRDGLLGDPVREMMCCKMRRRGAEVVVTMRASGFLYRMCRCIVGTLVQVGVGRMQLGDVRALLCGGARQDAGPNAPAHGLVLWRVGY